MVTVAAVGEDWSQNVPFLLPPTTLFTERIISAHLALTCFLHWPHVPSPLSQCCMWGYIYCSSFGNFTSSFQMSATKSKITSGTGSSSWCFAVVAVGSKKCHQHLVTGKVTPSSTTKEGIYSTVQFSASSCTDKSMNRTGFIQAF